MNKIDNPKRIKLSEIPEQGERISKKPVVVFVIVFLIIISFLIVRSEKKRKKNTEASSTVQKEENFVINKSESQWYDAKEYREKKLLKRKKENPVTEEEITYKIISEQERKFNQLLIGEDYTTKTAIVKMRTAHLIEMEQMKYEAQKADLKVDVDLTSFQDKENGSIKNFSNSYKDISSNMPGQPNISSNGSQGGEGLNQQKHKEAFLREGIAEGDYLPNLKRKAMSRYEVKAGTYIPAAMITGLNSDLPGSISAMVTENVYDTVTGNYLLIPQGAKLIGTYDSNITYGQTRALVIWTRLIYPDGASINLERMQGVDMSGYAGVKGKTNNHYLRIYSNALLMSVVGVGNEILNSGSDSDSENEPVVASVGKQLGDVTGQMIGKNIDIQPTLTIKPGYKFKVAVLKDMVLEDLNND